MSGGTVRIPRGSEAVRLLELDAELGALLSPTRRAEAERELVVRTHRLSVGPWDVTRLSGASADHVGLLVLDGVRHRLGGLDRVRSTEIEDAPTSCGFALTGGDVTVRGRVHSDGRQFVAWRYADPDGGEHNTLNCSIADLELTVEQPGRGPERLETRGTAAYEIGMRETDHGIPVQPYADG